MEQKFLLDGSDLFLCIIRQSVLSFAMLGYHLIAASIDITDSNPFLLTIPKNKISLLETTTKPAGKRGAAI